MRENEWRSNHAVMLDCSLSGCPGVLKRNTETATSHIAQMLHKAFAWLLLALGHITKAVFNTCTEEPRGLWSMRSQRVIHD